MTPPKKTEAGQRASTPCSEGLESSRDSPSSEKPTTNVAVPQTKVDLAIRRCSAALAPVYRKDFDNVWNSILFYLEKTKGSQRHKELLKFVLYWTLLIPVARGRRGIMGNVAMVFNHWMTSFENRKVSKLEILKELLWTLTLIPFKRVAVKFNGERTYEILDDQEDGDKPLR